MCCQDLVYTCDLCTAQLIGEQDGKEIWFDRGTDFYDSNGFLTSIFPNHSSEAWKRLSGIDYVFLASRGTRII